MPVGYVNEDRSHAFVLVSFVSYRVRSALSLKKGAFETCLILLDEKGEYSLMCALLLAPISALLFVLFLSEGVIGVKPCGDTREKETKDYSLFGGPLVLKSERGKANYSAH